MVLALPENEARLHRLIGDLLDIPVHVRLIPEVHAKLIPEHLPQAWARPSIEELASIPMAHLRPGPRAHHQRALKRALRILSYRVRDGLPTSTLSAHGPSGSTLLACLLVCAAASVPYLSTLQNYFVGDDFGIVQLFSHKATFYFLSLFATPMGMTPTGESIWGFTLDELRPIVGLSYQFDFFRGGGSPVAFHASNIAFHVVTALLVLVIARFVVRLAIRASTFAGLVFAIFPINAEPVSWITGRADSLLAIFYLSAFIAYSAWRRTGVGWLYWGSLVAFFLALYNKQLALTLLPLLVLYDMVVERRGLRPSGWLMRVYGPFALLTTLHLLQRYIMFGSTP